MHDFAYFTLLVLVSSYACFTLGLFLFWTEIKTPVPTKEPLTTKITVIIPVRNEANSIGSLLKDLHQQTYDPTNFEVIVVNDSSTDNTAYVLKTFENASAISLKVIHLDNQKDNSSPKKRAIAAALDQATGDLIVTTDGDCRVGPDWLTALAACHESTGARFISGPVTFTQERTLTDHLQTVEFSSLIGAGAASIAAGSPSMCNGANLAYDKAVFQEVGGFADNAHLASGDDEFLMHKVAARYPGRVQFLKDSRAIVRTTAHRSWRDFYRQRKRWVSKWKHYQGIATSVLAVYVFACNASLVVALLGGMAGWFSWSDVGLIFVIKWLPEWLFIGAILVFLKKSRSILYILPVQILYPFYVSFFGLIAQSTGYTWKDRKLK